MSWWLPAVQREFHIEKITFFFSQVLSVQRPHQHRDVLIRGRKAYVWKGREEALERKCGTFQAKLHWRLCHDLARCLNSVTPDEKWWHSVTVTDWAFDHQIELNMQWHFLRPKELWVYIHYSSFLLLFLCALLHSLSTAREVVVVVHCAMPQL